MQTFPLLHNYLSITCVICIQISKEEDPAGDVMVGPSTVTDKMSGDDHVPDSGPPPQQISAVSHICFSNMYM